MWKRSESYAVAPTYDKLAEALADEEDIFVAKVDGTENQGLSSRFGVRGNPNPIIANAFAHNDMDCESRVMISLDFVLSRCI